MFPIHTADAVRDFQFITELNTLPHIYAKERRIDLHGAFPELAMPYAGTNNQPYDTMYRTLRKKENQRPDMIHELLRKYLPRHISWSEEERNSNRVNYGAGRAPELYSLTVNRLARFIIGVAGGCVLIVPMVLMTLEPSQTKSLVVVSVALVLFALGVGLVFEADNIQLSHVNLDSDHFRLREWAGAAQVLPCVEGVRPV